MTEDRKPRGILNMDTYASYRRIEQGISKQEVEIASRGFASLAMTIL
jgi:hypothetical protein